VILHNIIEKCLQVEEDGDCFFRNVFDVIKLFYAIFLDIVSSIDGKTFVEMGNIADFLTHEVNS
jgi:hypothetical protein